MKFKLDENFGARTQGLFSDFGHDVETVVQEGLSGASDDDLYEICRRESRCLITLDLDFADVVRFPPHLSGGIVVIRCPRNPSLTLLERLVQSFLTSIDAPTPLGELSPRGRLWIIEVDRIRVHQQPDIWDEGSE
jgi:predicted nuclease of predicted toxin-antitoxin system